MIRPYSPRNPLFPHNFLVVFLAFRIRHTQHVHTGGDGFHVNGGRPALLGRTCVCARHDPSLQIVQRNIRDDRAAAQFDEQNILKGIRIDLELGRFG